VDEQPEDVRIEGVSRLHPVNAIKSMEGVGTAYVSQPLFRQGDKLYGGTVCETRCDELAASIAEAWNERAERLKGGGA
jgi:hypothetical protein